MPSPPFHWPIFVVSLEIATQRRSEIAAQLQDAGLAFSFVDAIDGRTTLPAEWESRIDRDGAARHYGYPMSDSEFACALSHQLVYARILEEGLPGAVVLEDDAILTSEFAAFYRSGGYRAADFIQFFCFTARIYRGPGREILPTVRLARLAENAFMNVGYCLSARAARHLAAASHPLRARADWPADMTQVGARLTVPSIIRHPPPGQSHSYIQEGREQVFPPSFDFNAGHGSRWRRIFTATAWTRQLRRRLSRQIDPGFQA
ncbi:MAG: glycosyltransferase family 25 protein [Tabrizicola sp.]|jgi:glycosyl transferase family 25